MSVPSLGVRVGKVSESVTLKLNAKAVKLASSGKKIFNLTAGQLPDRPLEDFINEIQGELKNLKSFQYSPSAGFVDLRAKLIKHIEKTRGISGSEDFDCIISNGAKHVLTNIFSALLSPNDEVVILAPYWVTYPELIKIFDGIPRVVTSGFSNNFTPQIADIRKQINNKTKMIVINSPNNPAGFHYSQEWMKELANLLTEFPHLWIICDEIYFDLVYYDSPPKYFYHYNAELLKRTIIVDGISKSLASAGLRLGFGVGPKEVINAMSILQGHTTSGSSSLIQRALMEFDFTKIPQYMKPILESLRNNSTLLQEVLTKKKLDHLFYQSQSAMYFMLDFSATPFFSKFTKNDGDYSTEICDLILDQIGVAIVPGTDFGIPNSGRISLVLEKEAFKNAIELLTDYLSN